MLEAIQLISPGDFNRVARDIQLQGAARPADTCPVLAVAPHSSRQQIAVSVDQSGHLSRLPHDDLELIVLGRIFECAGQRIRGLIDEQGLACRVG